MTILYLEGFDGSTNVDGAAGNADVQDFLWRRGAAGVAWYGSGNGVQTYTGRGGGRAYSPGNDNTGHFMTRIYDFDTVTEVYLGFAMKPGFTSVMNAVFIEWQDIESADGEQLMCYMLNATDLAFFKQNFYNPSTWFGTAENMFDPGVWSYVEIYFKCNGTTGAVTVKRDGVTKLALTSLDTDRLVGQVSRVTMNHADGTITSPTKDGVYLIDDLYITDSEFLGPVVVEEILPDGEGDNIDFSPSTGADNSATVDETPLNRDTDYNSSGTSSDLDLLTCTNLTRVAADIKAVKVDVTARTDGPGVVGCIPKVKSGTTEGDGTTQGVADDQQYDSVQHIFDENPDTTAAWTVSDVNGMQAGYEVD